MQWRTQADVIKVFNAPYGSHQLIAFRNTPLIIVSGAGLDGPGYTLIADESVAGELFALLASKVSSSQDRAVACGLWPVVYHSCKEQ